MDRRYSDFNDWNTYRNENRRYEGYNRNDGRNVTNQFERDYQRERGHRNGNDSYPSQYRPSEDSRYGANDRYRGDDRSYGSRGVYQRHDRDQDSTYSDNFSRDRDRFSNYQNDFRGDQGMQYSGRDNRRMNSNIDENSLRRGYGISSYGGTSDRYNTLNSDHNRGGGDDRGDRDGYRSSRFGGGIGDAFPSSHRGIPDATNDLGNFSDDYGSGLGSSYGGKNYGAGTGYMGGHRGGSSGNQSYGTSAGNYGGYGSMQSGTYGGRTGLGGNTSHNSDRGVTELGGF